jgi:hypothetical protein
MGGQKYLFLKYRGCEGVDWIHLAEDRVQIGAAVNTIRR